MVVRERTWTLLDAAPRPPACRGPGAARRCGAGTSRRGRRAGRSDGSRCRGAVKKSQARRSSFCSVWLGSRLPSMAAPSSPRGRTSRSSWSHRPRSARRRGPGPRCSAAAGWARRASSSARTGVDPLVDRLPVLLGDRVRRRDMQEDHADMHTGGDRDDGERERGGDLVREGEGGDTGGRGERGAARAVSRYGWPSYGCWSPYCWGIRAGASPEGLCPTGDPGCPGGSDCPGCRGPSEVSWPSGGELSRSGTAAAGSPGAGRAFEPLSYASIPPRSRSLSDSRRPSRDSRTGTVLRPARRAQSHGSQRPRGYPQRLTPYDPRSSPNRTHRPIDRPVISLPVGSPPAIGRTGPTRPHRSLLLEPVLS